MFSLGLNNRAEPPSPPTTQEPPAHSCRLLLNFTRGSWLYLIISLSVGWPAIADTESGCSASWQSSSTGSRCRNREIL